MFGTCSEDWVLAVKEPHYANLSIYDENLVPTKVSVCTSLTDVDLIWGLCLGPEPEGDMLYLAEDQSYEVGLCQLDHASAPYPC